MKVIVIAAGVLLAASASAGAQTLDDLRSGGKNPDQILTYEGYPCMADAERAPNGGGSAVSKTSLAINFSTTLARIGFVT